MTAGGSAARPDGRRTRGGPARWWIGLVLLLSCATACSALSPSAAPSSPGGAPTPSATGSPAGGADDLAAAKKAAQIRDCPADSSHATAQQDGLPEVTLQCLGGGPDVALAGLHGTPMVINIWAQWCGPCRREAPFLSTVAARAGNKINFLGIDYDDPDPAAAIAYAGKAQWRYPQLQDRQKLIKPGLKILGPPQTLFVDADGRIVSRHSGPFTSQRQLTEEIHDHLGVKL